MLFDRPPKMALNVFWVKEPRRAWEVLALFSVGLLSSDILFVGSYRYENRALGMKEGSTSEMILV